MTALRVLLIDDEALVRDELGGLLEDEGYELSTASDGQEGLVRFRDEAPDMVITDVRMPRRDGLSVAMAIRQESPKTPVTVITGHGNESMVLEALRAGVTDFIKKPVRFEELTMALERMEAALALARQQVAELPPAVTVDERSWVYTFRNDLSVIPLFVDVLLRRGGVASDAKTEAELSVALREMLINAVEHGSFELTYEEKSRALEMGTLTKVLEERFADPVFSKRKVMINVRRTSSQICIQIRDEGPGFNWRALPDPTDPTYLLADHGRGVLLARLSVDDLSYNAAGNKVTLVKQLVTNTA